jgi:hypothetical protein
MVNTALAPGLQVVGSRGDGLRLVDPRDRGNPAKVGENVFSPR